MSARVATVDALRGFALIGIALVNVWFYADPVGALGGAARAGSTLNSGTGAVISFVLGVLADGKFYHLFGFLFGYSIALQAQAAARVGADALKRTRRRAAGLATIGLVHGLVLWPGDILVTYALCGSVLMLWQPRRVSLTAGVLIGFATLMWAGLGAILDATQDDAILASTSYSEGVLATLTEHLTQYPIVALSVLFGQGPTALAMMLLGRAAAQRRLLEDPSAHTTLLRRGAGLGLAVGLAASVVYALNVRDLWGIPAALGLPAIALFGPAQSLAYLAILTLAWSAGRGRWLRRALAPAGRMALTNYLGQSVIFCAVFTGYGLGLSGTIPAETVVAIVLAMTAAQALLSACWLRSHPYGPAEWALRSWTYGARQPWRH